MIPIALRCFITVVLPKRTAVIDNWQFTGHWALVQQLIHQILVIKTVSAPQKYMHKCVISTQRRYCEKIYWKITTVNSGSATTSQPTDVCMNQRMDWSECFDRYPIQQYNRWQTHACGASFSYLRTNTPFPFLNLTIPKADGSCICITREEDSTIGSKTTMLRDTSSISICTAYKYDRTDRKNPKEK